MSVCAVCVCLATQSGWGRQRSEFGATPSVTPSLILSCVKRVCQTRSWLSLQNKSEMVLTAFVSVHAYFKKMGCLFFFFLTPFRRTVLNSTWFSVFSLLCRCLPTILQHVVVQTLILFGVLEANLCKALKACAVFFVLFCFVFPPEVFLTISSCVTVLFWKDAPEKLHFFNCCELDRCCSTPGERAGLSIPSCRRVFAVS